MLAAGYIALWLWVVGMDALGIDIGIVDMYDMDIMDTSDGAEVSEAPCDHSCTEYSDPRLHLSKLRPQSQI